MENKESYGKITVGVGSSEQHELKILSYVQARYKDNRVISISEIEDGSFVSAVENPESTGRNPQSTIWLSKESLIGLLTTAMMYFEAKGESLDVLLKQVVVNDNIDYSFSDNLVPLSESKNLLVKIKGCDNACGFEQVCKESDLENVAKKIYAEHPNEDGYYNFTKFLWVEFPDDRPDSRLDDLVPYDD